MPKFKYRLSRAEQAIHKQCLRELQAEGIIDEVSEDDLPARHPLEITVGSSAGNRVFETHSGWAAHYAVYVQLVAQESGLVITRWALHNAWDADIAEESPNGNDPLWNFCGQLFPREEILNSRIEDGLRFFRRGQMIEGWLLASGRARIPRKINDGDITACQLAFWDSQGEEIETSVDLSVFRSTPENDAAVLRRFGVKTTVFEAPSAAHELDGGGDLAATPQTEGGREVVKVSGDRVTKN
jgi:hypothetical protein